MKKMGRCKLALFWPKKFNAGILINWCSAKKVAALRSLF